MTTPWWQDAPIGDGGGVTDMKRFWTTLFTRRAWAELAYAVLALPLGIAGFVFVVVTVTVSGGLMVTLVGLPLLATAILVTRHLGSWRRLAANGLVGWHIGAPVPFRRRPGFGGWIRSCLTDGPGWRAASYLVISLPLGIASFVTAVVSYSIGLGWTSYWIWYRFLPCQTEPGSEVCHRAAQLWNGHYLETTGDLIALAVIGAMVLLVAPWVVRAVIQLDRLCAQALLGPWSSARVAELEETRATAVEDSAAMLRRIERDLHDGTQARLVSLAMNVGLARQKLAEGNDPEGMTTLLDHAHATAKQAIAEVRDLARGIHPPVLDTGLDAALATLTAHSTVPVRLHTAIDTRPAAAIETMAYFCAAELLTNVAKHSSARQCTVEVWTAGGRLVLRVSDDGVGGAVLAPHGGLAGLRERVRTVDGTLTVDSPAGGPTRITLDLPSTTGQVQTADA